LNVARNDSEALFWEMVRSLALAIGWVLSALFSLLGLLIDGINNLIRDSQEQTKKKKLRSARKRSSGLMATPPHSKRKRPL
jgi:hypothetical protein